MALEETQTALENQRIHMLKEKLFQSGVDAFFISDLYDIRWLTKFSGSSATVVITKQHAWLFTDFRYEEQVKREVQGATPVIVKNTLEEELKSPTYNFGTKIGFQADKLSYSTVQTYKEQMPNHEWIPLTALCDEFVMIKEPAEVESMRKAVEISDKVFDKLLSLITPSATELDIAAEISYWNKKFGADKDSFDPIVASGPNGALPHARPSHQKLQPNNLIVIDMGCVFNGYASDQTRTVALGKISNEAKSVYNAVLESQLLGIETAQAGISGKDVDEKVRTFLDEKGYGKYFGHALGHGVGLQVHEKPVLSKRNEKPLMPMNVVTVEPGVYIPGKFGVRIEDMVVIHEGYSEPLQKSPKKLIEL